MNTQNNTNPLDLMIETVATLLVLVGGYKDAAEAVKDATDIIEAFADSDPQISLAAAMELRVLTIQAQGVSNAIANAQNDDADQSVRFVADEGDALPEGPVAEGPVNPDDAIRDLLASIFPGAQIIKLTGDELAQAVGPQGEEAGYVRTPFGMMRVG